MTTHVWEDTVFQSLVFIILVVVVFAGAGAATVVKIRQNAS